jgi:alkyl hydroperoxide reductase subunit AhpC
VKKTILYWIAKQSSKQTNQNQKEHYMSEEITPKQEVISLPRINEAAPQFKAKTTHGEISLSDYKGKWVVLFSHPADFTPVCTTEFIAFAKKYDDFQKLNTQVIGLSIDSIYSHIAWVRNIEDNFKLNVPFPVIADLDMSVAKKYGMVHPEASDTSAVRAVFVIPSPTAAALMKFCALWKRCKPRTKTPAPPRRTGIPART